MAQRIDLNSDMGESFGWYTIGADEQIITSITSANLGCGFHGGDPHVMRRSVRLAQEHGVAVGAHPGFPDLLGFGRRNLAATPAQIKDYIQYQVGALQAFAHVASLTLQHVKTHGALYMMALEDEALSAAVVEAVAELDERLLLYTLPGSATDHVARRKGLRVVREFFADRPISVSGWIMFGYHLADVGGTPEAIAQRALRAIRDGVVRTVEGQELPFQADTICVHSDTPSGPTLMRAVRVALEQAGITVQAAGSFL